MSGFKTRAGVISIAGLSTQALPSPQKEALQPLSAEKVTIAPASSAIAPGVFSVPLTPIAELFPPAGSETRFQLPPMESIAMPASDRIMPLPLSFQAIEDTTLSENQAAKVPVQDSDVGNLISKFQPEILSVISYESPFKEEASTALSSVGIYQKMLYESNRKNIGFVAKSLEASTDRPKYATECSRQVSNLEEVIAFGVSIETSKKVTENAFRFSEWLPNISAYIAKNYSQASADLFDQTIKKDSGTGTEILVNLAQSAKSSLRGLSSKQIDLNQSLSGFVFPKYENMALEKNDYRAFVASVFGMNKFLEQETAGAKDDRMAKLSAFLKREIAISSALARSSVTSKFDFFSPSTLGFDLFEKCIGATDTKSPYTVFAASGLASTFVNAAGVAFFDNVPTRQNGSSFSTGVQEVAKTCFVKAGKFQPEILFPIRDESRKYSKQISALLNDLFCCHSLKSPPEYVNDQIEFTDPAGAISVAEKLFFQSGGSIIPGRESDPICRLLAAADDDQKLFSELSFYLLTRCFDVSVSKAVGDDSFDRVVGKFFEPTSLPTTQSVFSENTPKNAAAPLSTTKTEFIIELNQNTDLLLKLKANLAHISSICRYLNNTLDFNGKTRYSGMSETTVLIVYLRLVCQVANSAINGRRPNLFGGVSGFSFASLGNVASVSSAKKIAQKTELQLCTNLVRLQSFFDNVASSVDSHAALLNDTRTALQLTKLQSLVQDTNAVESLFQAGSLRLLQKLLVDAKESMTKLGLDSLGVEKATMGYKENSLLDGLTTVHSYLSQPEFSPFARANSRIFAIGVPYGVAEALDEQVRIAGADNDIISLSFTRKNELLPGVVFKPLKRYFEYSRFVSFVGENRLNYNANKSREGNMSELITFDFSNVGVVRSVGFSAFSASRYSNLSESMKLELLSNHYESLILKEHVKALSGISFDEDSFKEELVLPAPLPENTNFLKEAIGNLIASQKPVQGSPSAKRISTSIDKPRIQLKISSLANMIRAIPAAPQMINFSNGYLKEFGAPIYERVFCVLVDPDFFEIDLQATKSTPAGALALSSLIQGQKIYDNNGKLYLAADQDFLYMDSYQVKMETA